MFLQLRNRDISLLLTAISDDTYQPITKPTWNVSGAKSQPVKIRKSYNHHSNNCQFSNGKLELWNKENTMRETCLV